MLKLDQHNDLATLVARLFFASLFVTYGYFKITAFAGTTGYMAKQGLPMPAVFAVIAVIIELGGGLFDSFWLSHALRRSDLRDLCADRGADCASQFRRRQPDVALLQKYGDRRRLSGAHGQRRRPLFAGWTQVAVASIEFHVSGCRRWRRRRSCCLCSRWRHRWGWRR